MSGEANTFPKSELAHAQWDAHDAIAYLDPEEALYQGLREYDLFATRQDLEETRHEAEVAAQESQEREAELIEEAYTDEATGLPNRKRFRLDLEKLTEGGIEYSLLLIDLDGFKEINDKLGHPAGDSVLEHVGEHIENVFRNSYGDSTPEIDDRIEVVHDKSLATENSTRAANQRSDDSRIVDRVLEVYRIGGDEFAVIIDIDDQDELDGLARRLNTLRMNLRVQTNGESESIVLAAMSAAGLVIEEGSSASDLVRRVDSELYEAKKANRTDDSGSKVARTSMLPVRPKPSLLQ